MKKVLILAGLAAATGAIILVTKKRKKKPKVNRKKKKGKRRKKSAKKNRLAIPEKRLKDYPLGNEKKLNKLEKLFLADLRKSDPEGSIIVKQREPIVNEEGFTEFAYLIKYPNGERFMVTPKIVDKKTFWIAQHEVCHDEIGHQDEDDPDSRLRPRNKEFQVEDCLILKSEKYGIDYNPRSKRSIRRAYK